MSSNVQYIVGIDLGTTNTTVSYARKDASKRPQIEQFLIPQILQDESRGSQSLLPSFLYFPLEEEKAALDIESQVVVGQYAQRRSCEVAERCISSSKSWLSNSTISALDPFLPLEGGEVKMSPVACASEILKTILQGWNLSFPDAFLEHQEVYVTVPASFAPQARSYVTRAIEEIGLKATLIEEPQAALYAWLWDHDPEAGNKDESWKERFQVGDSLLVIDIGGGTTDFSLVRVAEDNKELTFSRVAVGPHLLLGGDNIDHALAQLLTERMSEKNIHLDEWQERMLVALARRGKEQLLNGRGKLQEIVLPGRGSKVIAKSLKTELLRDDIESICLDGFFPIVFWTDAPEQKVTSALRSVGLEYAHDPRITVHLVSFLRNELSSNGQIKMPKAVLFNGGTMKAGAFQKRIMENLNSWAKETGEATPELLGGVDLDFAVSKGAVSYGLSKIGYGMRIKSSLPRAYYVGIEEARPAIPGITPPISALCVAPIGMEEGTSQDVPGKRFSLVLGRPVQLKFFMSKEADGSESNQASTRAPYAGQVIKKSGSLYELHPIEANLERTDQDQETADVQLVSTVDELGTLKLSCKSDDGRTWNFEFHTRT